MGAEPLFRPLSVVRGELCPFANQRIAGDDEADVARLEKDVPRLALLVVKGVDDARWGERDIDEERTPDDSFSGLEEHLEDLGYR